MRKSDQENDTAIDHKGAKQFFWTETNLIHYIYSQESTKYDMVAALVKLILTDINP